MKAILLVASLGCAALVLISPLSALAINGEPIPGTDVGLEGDPNGIVIATTKSDADGRFEFKNVKAGKYRLVIQSPQGDPKQAAIIDQPAAAAAKQAAIGDGSPWALTVRINGACAAGGGVMLLVDPNMVRFRSNA